MGKYMRKVKVSGEVAIMDVSSAPLGVRTRARALALQRLQKQQAQGEEGAGGEYLELRSRRLEKLPPPAAPMRRKAAAAAAAAKEEVEASYGENMLELEAMERNTRETTPCSLINSEMIGTPRTPGSTTRSRAEPWEPGARDGTGRGEHKNPRSFLPPARPPGCPSARRSCRPRHTSGFSSSRGIGYTTSCRMVLWVFGYGSLIWNPGFDFDDKILGFIKGYKRTFNLACIDHRGTPEHPARTCTLETDDEAICWGIAYCVKGGPEKERKAMQYLERRECEYDQKISIDFYKEGDPLKPAVTGILVFVSTPDPIGNKYYLGSAPLQDMARQIATANGPTGYNRDYLFSMEKALASISHEDDSIIELADEVRKVLNRTKETKITGANASLKSHVPLVHLSALPEGTVVDSR